MTKEEFETLTKLLTQILEELKGLSWWLELGLKKES